MKNIILDEQIASVMNKISSDKQYWFLRTMGGTYYDEFCSNGFIAIGYESIMLKELKNLPKNENEARSLLKNQLKYWETGLSDKQIPKAAGQLLKFYRNMNIGDTVVIPSPQSKRFAIGNIISDIYEDASTIKAGECKFSKRRKVKWHSDVARWELDPKLLLSLSNQQTMSRLDEYSEFIDRKESYLYTKGDKSYLVLRVSQDKGLSWDDFCFISDLGELFKEVSNKEGLEVDLSKIEMRVNVQSPGDILMIVPSDYKILLTFAFFVIMSVLVLGGKFNARFFSFETNGLGPLFKQILDTVAAFLDSRQERKLRMLERMNNLKFKEFSGIDKESSESENNSDPSSLHD